MAKESLPEGGAAGADAAEGGHVGAQAVPPCGRAEGGAGAEAGPRARPPRRAAAFPPAPRPGRLSQPDAPLKPGDQPRFEVPPEPVVLVFLSFKLLCK